MFGVLIVALFDLGFSPAFGFGFVDGLLDEVFAGFRRVGVSGFAAGKDSGWARVEDAADVRAADCGGSDSNAKAG